MGTYGDHSKEIGLAMFPGRFVLAARRKSSTMYPKELMERLDMRMVVMDLVMAGLWLVAMDCTCLTMSSACLMDRCLVSNATMGVWTQNLSWDGM